MALCIDFPYMEICKKSSELKGNYLKNMGIPVYEKYGLEVYVFVSLDYRHTCLVQRYYGTYTLKEC